MKPLVVTTMSIQALGRLTLVNAFVKHTSRRIDHEFLFVLLEDLFVGVSQAFDLVNVLDIIVGTIARNETSCTRIHATKLHVFSLE